MVMVLIQMKIKLKIWAIKSAENGNVAAMFG